MLSGLLNGLFGLGAIAPSICAWRPRLSCGRAALGGGRRHLRFGGCWQHIRLGLIAFLAKVRAALHLRGDGVRRNSRKHHFRPAFWAGRAGVFNSQLGHRILIGR